MTELTSKLSIQKKEQSSYLLALLSLKKAKNMENAKKFIDFIISQEVQDTLGTTTTNRPVRKNAKTSENMKPIDKIKNTHWRLWLCHQE